MTIRSILFLSVAGLLLWACNDDAQKIAPSFAGQRGEACQARNDCQSGLACIQGICSRNDFDIAAAAKQCDVVECQTTADCCGDKPTTAPAKCAAIPSVCDMPTLPNCVTGSCTSNAECSGGVCGNGFCDTSFDNCSDDTDCADVCDVGQCLRTGATCSIDADCAGTCQGRSCDCDNPQWDPSAAICSDPDCQGVCALRCTDERCVEDDSCESDLDCPFNARMCTGGRCVQCMTDDDCDSEESCLDGFCKSPCKQNEECPLFHACESGECVETGCQSDRECVLALAGEMPEDSRLAKCLPADDPKDNPVCKVPCENDGACSEFQVCEKGYCVFIGCESDEECRAYLNIENQNPTGTAPFVPKAVCR